MAAPCCLRVRPLTGCALFLHAHTPLPPSCRAAMMLLHPSVSCAWACVCVWTRDGASSTCIVCEAGVDLAPQRLCTGPNRAEARAPQPPSVTVCKPQLHEWMACATAPLHTPQARRNTNTPAPLPRPCANHSCVCDGVVRPSAGSSREGPHRTSLRVPPLATTTAQLLGSSGGRGATPAPRPLGPGPCPRWTAAQG